MRFPAAALTFVFLLTSSSARAATLRVPSEYPTINAGLSASTAGDTVLVAPGTYSDFEVRLLFGFDRTSCAFLVDGVVLRSEGGSSVTTIDLQGVVSPRATIVFGAFLTSGSTRVEGFTIRGTPFGRPGVSLSASAKVSFRGCAFEDLDGGVTSAGGIRAADTDLDVINCTFTNCRANLGGGIAQGDASLYVSGCAFTQCSTGIDALGNPGSNTYSVLIENSIFLQNTGAQPSSSAAMSIGDYAGGVDIIGCTFVDNESGSVGAVGISSLAGPIRLERCVFWNNRGTLAGSTGGAVFAAGQTFVLRSNTFHANTSASPLDGAAVVLQGSPADFSNNVVSETTGGGAAVRLLRGSVVGECNVFWDNPNGNTTYVQPATDQEADPQFCDPAIGDFTVRSSSPCLPQNNAGCGLIGALGEGCGVIGVDEESWARIKDRYRP